MFLRVKWILSVCFIKTISAQHNEVNSSVLQAASIKRIHIFIVNVNTRTLIFFVNIRNGYWVNNSFLFVLLLYFISNILWIACLIYFTLFSSFCSILFYMDVLTEFLLNGTCFKKSLFFKKTKQIQYSKYWFYTGICLERIIYNQTFPQFNRRVSFRNLA